MQWWGHVPEGRSSGREEFRGGMGQGAGVRGWSVLKCNKSYEIATFYRKVQQVLCENVISPPPKVGGANPTQLRIKIEFDPQTLFTVP